MEGLRSWLADAHRRAWDALDRFRVTFIVAVVGLVIAWFAGLDLALHPLAVLGAILVAVYAYQLFIRPPIRCLRRARKKRRAFRALWNPGLAEAACQDQETYVAGGTQLDLRWLLTMIAFGESKQDIKRKAVRLCGEDAEAQRVAVNTVGRLLNIVSLNELVIHYPVPDDEPMFLSPSGLEVLEGLRALETRRMYGSPGWWT